MSAFAPTDELVRTHLLASYLVAFRTYVRSSLAMAVAVLSGALLLAACSSDSGHSGGNNNNGDNATRSTEVVNSLGWSAQSVLCSGFDPASAANEALRQLGPGELGVLGADPASVISELGCTPATPPAGGAPETPVVDSAHSYFFVGTGADRLAVELTDIKPRSGGSASGGEPSAVSATVTLKVLDKNCVTTMEYRGNLLLLLQGPVGALPPTIDFRTQTTNC